MTTTMSVENPKLSSDALALLEQKIKDNRATVKDYEDLDYFLSSIVSSNYIMETLKAFGINDYDEFISERKKPFDKKKRFVDGELLGNVLGSISFLKNYLNK